MSSTSTLHSLYHPTFKILPLHITLPYFSFLIVLELMAHWVHWKKWYHVFAERRGVADDEEEQDEDNSEDEDDDEENSPAATADYYHEDDEVASSKKGQRLPNNNNNNSTSTTTNSPKPHKPYHQKYRPFYRINDAISSLICGICEQIYGKLLMSSWSFLIYCGVYHYGRFLDWTFTSEDAAGMMTVQWHWPSLCLPLVIRILMGYGIVQWIFGIVTRGAQPVLGLISQIIPHSWTGFMDAFTETATSAAADSSSSYWGPLILLHSVAFILKDYGYYWFHREVHVRNVGWATHAVHHNSEEYNLTTALRQGMLQSVVGPFFYIPMALLGIPPSVYSLHTTINLLWQFWIHTRAIQRFPSWFEYIFNTPSHHRVHHGRQPEAIDKNYGGTLILFDRWHGTFQEEGRENVFGTVHPLQSFNPLTSQFHHVRHIFWTCVSRGFKPRDWWNILFQGPGYDVDSGEEYPIPEVHEHHSERYNPHLNWPDTYFSLFYLLHATSVAVCYLIQGEELNMLQLFSQWLYQFSGLISLGYIIDGCRFRARQVELFRFLIGIAGLYFDNTATIYVFPLLWKEGMDLLWMVEHLIVLGAFYYVMVVYQGDVATLHEKEMYMRSLQRGKRSFFGKYGGDGMEKKHAEESELESAMRI